MKKKDIYFLVDDIWKNNINRIFLSLDKSSSFELSLVFCFFSLSINLLSIEKIIERDTKFINVEKKRKETHCLILFAAAPSHKNYCCGCWPKTTIKGRNGWVCIAT